MGGMTEALTDLGYEAGYRDGESSGYADWWVALDEATGIRDERPSKWAERVEAVFDLHQPKEHIWQYAGVDVWYTKTVCAECSRIAEASTGDPEAGYSPVPYPCPTALALGVVTG